MRCPGQASIQSKTKKKKINSFYMNAQQAVLVRVQEKCTVAQWKHKTKHIPSVYIHTHTQGAQARTDTTIYIL